MVKYAKVKEVDIEKVFKAGVERLGGKAFKLKFLGLSGAPDRLVIMPKAKVYFVELKREGGSLESSQKALFPIIEKLGFDVRILVGHSAVKEFIRELAKDYLKRTCDV